REQNAAIDLQTVPKQGRRSVGTNAGLHPDDTNSLSGNLYNTRLPSRSTTWLSATQPGRTSTGTYAGIPGDASHSTAVVRNSPKHVQPYRRDVSVHIHNGPPPPHMRRASRPAPTTTQPSDSEDEEEQPPQKPKNQHLTLRRVILCVAILL